MSRKGCKNKIQKGCKIVGCDKVHYGNGFCRLHYLRQQKIKDFYKHRRSDPEYKEKQYRRKMRIIYNLAPSQYEEIFKKQNGRCKLCNRHQSELTLRLNIEHDHLTNKVRGLTCTKCNLEIAYFELFQKNPEKAKKIKGYLSEPTL